MNVSIEYHTMFRDVTYGVFGALETPLRISNASPSATMSTMFSGISCLIPDTGVMQARLVERSSMSGDAVPFIFDEGDGFCEDVDDLDEIVWEVVATMWVMWMRLCGWLL